MLLRTALILSILAVTLLPTSAQNRFRIMEYNVENLFDCEHDTLKNDFEFTPEGNRKWTYKRYRDKLIKIAKVIAAASDPYIPDLVALCEVENERVIRDLTRYTPLKEVGYQYVVTDSPDERGVDVALLYQPGRFKLLAWRSIRIPSKQIEQKPTRDLLHVTGQVLTGDTLDVFVCHMPSRSNGQRETEPFRLFTASILKAQADSVIRERQNPYLIITGDFNDYPANKAIVKILQAMQPNETPEPSKLYNLTSGRKNEGTYRYQGEWGFLDQMIVSGRLLSEESRLRTDSKEVHVMNLPFLVLKEKRYGGVIPYRTYRGTYYAKGYSDHLPLLLDIYSW